MSQSSYFKSVDIGGNWRGKLEITWSGEIGMKLGG